MTYLDYIMILANVGLVVIICLLLAYLRWPENEDDEI